MTKSQKVLYFSSGTVLLLLIVATVFVVSGLTPTPVHKVRNTAVYVYPSPNKTQQDFHIPIVRGTLGLTVGPLLGEFNADKQLASEKYYVDYSNYQSVPASVPLSAALTVGCIARGNHSFREVPSIFTNGAYPAQPVGFAPISLTAPFVLAPREQKRVTFQVHGSCQYVGTQDGHYWWPVPKLGE